MDIIGKGRLKVLVVFLLLQFVGWTFGMAQGINMQNLASVKVDSYTDAQIAQFVKNYTSKGYTLADVEKYAKERKMPASELEKLKKRISEVGSKPQDANIEDDLSGSNSKSTANNKNSDSSAVSSSTVKEEDSRVFGSSLFRNSKISFEPNQSMATPRNYIIGTGDVIHIDVYGLSEASYDLTVSKEGTVLVKNVGVVTVSGKTLEEVEKTLKKKLSAIYNSVHSGSTEVSVTLSQIRSIKVYIMGEVNSPGSYVLPSVSSVFNAMSACGGPTENGSYRSVKLIRSGKEIANVDLYEFLISGIMPSDVTLQDQDVIQVPTYGVRATIEGFVKRPGIYELKSTENLNNLLNYCGGFTDDAYTERINVTRNMNGEKSVADVTKELYSMFAPVSGDVYTVGQVLNKYTNRVQILGSVQRPGVYALDEGMTLLDLVKKANGLTEDAFMQSATIVRLKEDLTPEISSFNVKDLMEGAYNDTLRKEDIVTIGGKSEFEPEKSISIYGSVIEQGVFPYYENITLRDLVFLARGFREEADPTHIEVVRTIVDAEQLANSDQKYEVYNLGLTRELLGEDGDFKLEPRDQVTVRSMEGYEQLGTVQILGEVRNPGTYSITRKTERISSVMERCGGLSKYGYAKNAFLIRTTQRTEAEKRRDTKLIEALKNGVDANQEKMIREELEKRQDLVGIKLEEVIDNPGCKSDLTMLNGDIIYVPRELETVTINGAVQVPGMEVYHGGSLRKYIRGAGGFSKNAKKSKTYVAYANGSVGATRHFLWWRNYPNVTAGAHIIVPEKPEKNDDDKKANATFFVSLFSSIATMGSVIVTAISVISR